MYIEYKAGKKMYVDFAGEKLQYLNVFTGDLCDAEVFVAILEASQGGKRTSELPRGCHVKYSNFPGGTGNPTCG
ncbi:MAG: hypothetical protein D4R64_16910 [Porphyromonadaceae bacterium]|nr:MAG: hypothetical protein D4R64_16910 [Porphyromonadaceae bacterium]